MDFFIGQITIFGFNFAPRYWSFCNGGILPISQNTALFSLLGTTYGGNGVSTYGLPDLRSRIPLHAPSSGGNISLGELGGQETVTLQLSQMPSHTHAFAATNDPSDQISETDHVFAMGVKSSDNPVAYANTPNAPLANATVSTSGGSQPHNNLQPYQALNFCIALNGVYPSRN
jgi:microcystin-dependent protein